MNLLRRRRATRPDAPKAPPGGSAFDWLTAEAGWVVPAINVPGLSTPERGDSSRDFREIVSIRDTSAPSSVGMAMVALLRPRSRWWDGLLAMSGLDDTVASPDPISGGDTSGSGRSDRAATNPATGTRDGRPPRDGARPDADLLRLEPAEQLAALTRRHADAVYRVALSVTTKSAMRWPCRVSS